MIILTWALERVLHGVGAVDWFHGRGRRFGLVSVFLSAISLLMTNLFAVIASGGFFNELTLAPYTKCSEGGFVFYVVLGCFNSVYFCGC